MSWSNPFTNRVQETFKFLIDEFGFHCGDLDDNEHCVTYCSTHCKIIIATDRGQFYASVRHPSEPIELPLRDVINYYDPNAHCETGFFETDSAQMKAMGDELRKIAASLQTACRPLLLGEFAEWDSQNKASQERHATWLATTEFGRRILRAKARDESVSRRREKD